MSDVILLEKDAGIATLTLNRPQAMNALDQVLAERLESRMGEVERDPEVRVVVVRGAGRAFMAGGDVKHFHEQASLGPDRIRATIDDLLPRVHRAILSMHRMPKPVIASIHGAAAGFGLSLALAADLKLAAAGTRFTLAYANIGTSPDGSSTYTLPRLVGLSRAMEIALLADFFDAEDALRMGMINRVVPPDELEAETRAMAERLARGPAEAYARTKALLRESLANNLETQLQREEHSFVSCAVTPDFAEGAAAFVEKREPKFGR